MQVEFVAIIPARFASTRLPGKLVKEIEGKSILERVYLQAKKSKKLNQIIIVTDHETIFNHAQSFGAECFLSSKQYESGTDRISEIAAGLNNVDYIINLQGDEPFIDPHHIDQLCFLLQNANANIATLAVCHSDTEHIKNPNFVKVVMNKQGRALYFSRAPIPFLRDAATSQMEYQWFRHIGIYGFKKEVLIDLSKLEVSNLEKFEKLEQLRWIENGYEIHVEIVDKQSIGIDTEQDYLEAIHYARTHNL